MRNLLFFIALATLFIVPSSNAQDMEPRTYSNAPIGTNFFGVGYSYSDGAVSVDPSLPVTNVKAKISTASTGYSRFFALGDYTANYALVLPYVDADVTGDVGEAHRKVTRSGLGDLRFRLAVNLIGDPPLTPEEFKRRKPKTSLGVSTTIVAPTGEYDPFKLINIGTNRWSFKPEIGISQPIGNWFVEGISGLWLFTDNNDFYGGHTRSQDPIGTFQVHSGYNFMPGLWLAADATYWVGGQTTVDGVESDDTQSNSRYGLTLSTPLSKDYSLKVAWSNGYTARVGGDFDTVIVALQYRWFDR